MASVMLPLFLPEGVTFDNCARARRSVLLRRGLHGRDDPRRSASNSTRPYEAADALGLSYPQKMGLIVLPQALKLVIPGIVNSFVGLFKIRASS